MLGAIVGDIVGSRFELYRQQVKSFELFAPGCRFTDDTVLTLALCQAFLDCDGNYAKLADCAQSNWHLFFAIREQATVRNYWLGRSQTTLQPTAAPVTAAPCESAPARLLPIQFRR